MRYFFHIRDGETLIEDPDGSEHASLDEACNEAIQSAREIMAANLIAGQPLDGRTFEITDAEGQLHRSLSFSAAIPPHA